MDGYRIRRGEVEKRVADKAALDALVASGALRPSDEIATSTGWVRADKHPVVRNALRAADPWAAWSDVDNVDAASLYKKMVDAPAGGEDEPTELPMDALTPVVEPPARRPQVAVATAPAAQTVPRVAAVPPVAPVAGPEPVPLDARAPRPLHDPARAPRPATLPPAMLEPLPEEGAEVIDFPRPRPPVPDLLVRPTPRRTGPPPLVRTSRVVSMVVAGLAFVLLGYAWIRMSAYTGVGQGSPVIRASAGGVVEQPPLSPLVPLDAELRAALPVHPRDVKEPGDLSDALLVELVQQRLEIIEANGLVTKWVGRKGDEPKTAEVRITYRSGGDMTRELGAIALVVGRYKRFYRLDMPVFEVTEAGSGVTRIRAEDAEAYYQARMTLEELLTTLVKK